MVALINTSKSQVKAVLKRKKQKVAREGKKFNNKNVWPNMYFCNR